MNDLIDAHLSHIAAAGLAASTIKTRRQLLGRLDRDLPYGLEVVATEELIAWLATPGWSIATRALYGAHIRAFFDWACDPRDAWLDYNPALPLPKPRVHRGVPRPVSQAEVALALVKLPEPWRLYVLLATFAGLRCCEIAALERDDITDVNVTLRGKGGKQRAVPTHPLIWAAVAEMPSGPVTRAVNGRAPGAAYISNGGRDALHAVGVKATMHRFRHRFGTDVNAGGNTRVAQELLGHASLQSTQVYTQVTAADKRAAVFGLHNPATAA